MNLIANNNQIIYTNGGSDPYTNGNAGAMIGENQTNLDAVIMTANYDIGHVFGTNSGGVAALNSPCTTTSKARGVTGSGARLILIMWRTKWAINTVLRTPSTALRVRATAMALHPPP
jgi:Metallo-peptidase family M12B Reprolysin-like